MANISAGWPEGVAGAVSLSFDDGSQSQLDIALPILEEYGLLGTFYINPSGEDWLERLAPWRDASQRGHEIGNHTVEHICCRNYSPSPDRKSLESSTLDEIEADVAEADQRLDALIPERPARTFCYPCYQSYVGEGSTRQSYVPVIARRFPAARGRGEAANEPALTDLHYLSSWPVAGWMSGEQLCGFAADAAAKKRWAILTFHQFQVEPASAWVPASADHAPPLPAAAFRTLCEYLRDEGERIWTAPVVTVARHVIAWRATTMKDR